MISRTVSIADQVGEHKASAVGQVPADVFAVFEAEQTALTTAGVPAGVASPGTLLPDTQLVDAHSAPTSLYAWIDGRSAVIVFYRGAWCPYCNITLRSYQEQLVPQLAERDVGMVAISPQKPDGSLSMQEKNELTFAVLSDPGNVLAGRLGILTAPTVAARAAQAHFGLDLTAANADGTHALPMPTVVIVDTGHIIRWIDVHPDYTTRTEVADVMGALALMQSPG